MGDVLPFSRRKVENGSNLKPAPAWLTPEITMQVIQAPIVASKMTRREFWEWLVVGDSPFRVDGGKMGSAVVSVPGFQGTLTFNQFYRVYLDVRAEAPDAKG